MKRGMLAIIASLLVVILVSIFVLVTRVNEIQAVFLSKAQLILVFPILFFASLILAARNIYSDDSEMGVIISKIILLIPLEFITFYCIIVLVLSNDFLGAGGIFLYPAVFLILSVVEEISIITFDNKTSKSWKRAFGLVFGIVLYSTFVFFIIPKLAVILGLMG